MRRSVLARFRGRRRDSGASAVEYGLIVAAIAAVLLLTTVTLGSAVRDTLFGAGCAAMTEVNPDGPGAEDCPEP